MHAAGVVADHTTNEGAVVRAGFGAEEQAVGRKPAVEGRADHRRFDAHPVILPIQFEDVIEAARIDEEAAAHYLPGGRGAGPARHQRHMMLRGPADHGPEVLDPLRQDDPHRELAVGRGVGRIDHAIHPIHENPPLDPTGEAPQRFRQWTVATG